MRSHVRTLAAMTGLTVAALAFTACNEGSTLETVVMHADYPLYDSVESAAGTADVVITGVYLDSRTELLYPAASEGADPAANPQAGVDEEDIDLDELAIVRTINTVRVTEVLKGDLQIGDVLEVSQLGGTTDEQVVTEESTTPLSSIEEPEFALLLNELGNGTYDLVHPQQGLFVVDEESVESISPDTDFQDIETVADLEAQVDES